MALPSNPTQLDYYTLDEASGNGLGALSNNLTDTNSCGTTTGKINGARTFNGTNKYLSGALGSGSYTNLSIAGWLNRSNAGTMMGIAGWGVNNGNRFNILNYVDGNTYWQCENGGSSYGSSAHSGTGLHHFAMTYDGSQSTNATKLKGYIDGVAQTISFSGVIPSTWTVVGNFEIGREGAFARFANGSADEWGAWSSTLSAADVTALYNAGAGFAYPFSSFKPYFLEDVAA